MWQLPRRSRTSPPEAEATQAQLENIDGTLCHQQAYRRVKVDGVIRPREDNMAITIDEAAQTVHRPERINCLQCHAKAGGGDAVKRGALTIAHFPATSSTAVSTSTCRWLVATSSARPATSPPGTGSRAGVRICVHPIPPRIVECSNCHGSMANGEHEGQDIDRHTARVACQTCHIPVYAKDASDTGASEATEVHRTWLGHSRDHAADPSGNRSSRTT